MEHIILNNSLILKLRKNPFALTALLWLLLWVFSWTVWLDSFPWIRLGVSIIIFVIPGMVASLFLVGDRFTLLGHFSSGLALSVFLVGALGLIGRVFHLPFSYIKPVFALTGFVSLLMLAKRFRFAHQLYKPKKYSIITLILLLGMVVFAVSASIGNAFGGDDFSYLAYLTNWQHAQSLNFRDVFFGLESLGQVRFWLAVFPMSLAFLAEISNLHGLLLLGLYLEPFLVVIALLSIYNFYEDILLGEYLPVAALLLHLSFLYMLQDSRQVGSIFFSRLSEDKAFAAFVLVPVFFLAIRYFLETPTFRSVLFIFLSGWSLALTHPIILAYSIMIAGFYVFFLTITRKDYKRFGITVILLVVVILPSASLRFVGSPWISRYVFGLTVPLEQPGSFDLESANDKADAKNLISYIEGTPFYGFNPDRVKISTGKGSIEESLWQKILSWSYLWIWGLSFLWSLFNIKKNKAAAFVGATALFVLICAVPYTGWLVGYLVSARMLWRAPWMFPVGMAGVILINDFFGFILQRGKFQWKRHFSVEAFTLGSAFLLSLILVGFFSSAVYVKKWERLAAINDEKINLQKFADLGDFLEKEIKDASIFVAPREFSDYLPGISSKSKVVFFRTKLFTPHEVNTQILNLVFSPQSSVSIRQRVGVLEKYNIQYILIEERSLKDYYASYPDLFRAREFDGFWIIEFLEGQH